MGKTVLITGASRGIGRAMATVFAENNYHVMINYLKAEREARLLEQELTKQGYTVAVYRADVMQKAQVTEMIATGEKLFGSIDVLINNAGISQFKLFTEISEEEWDTMLNTHLKGMFNCCQGLLPSMIHQKKGKIINIASIWGLVGASCEVPYSTAKAGMIGFTKALAKEVGPSGIQVNCIAPGIIETEMNEGLNNMEKKQLKEETPLLRFGKPEEIAHLALYLASAEADFITGQVISPNGGFVI
ncbi:MAG: SDR family oxidoreductase [Clostridia bacterium]|nr:SDR family oxidoreductase [Clostridia bacterium]MDD4146500.1 SDR family oxidoreductase [Clostridia bacterium]MDD4666013.1 SDR family oxidoreductase [Clostridia bacterium]